MRRLILAIAGVVAVGACSAAEDWRADFEALKLGLARNYANFEQQITDRRISLPKLASEAETALASAGDNAARRKIFGKMIKDLHDPHVRIEWLSGDADEARGPACPADLAAAEQDGGLRWERLAAFRPLDEASSRVFRAGILKTAAGRMIGVIRIGLFMERAFTRPCAEAATAMGLAADAPCDDACGGKLERATGRRLDDALAATLDALQAAGATGIVLDVSNNHGGSDWVEPVTRIMGGPVHAARVSMVKHQAWVNEIGSRLSNLESNLPAATGERRAALSHAADEARAALAELSVSCDLSAAWTDPAYGLAGKALPCSNLVSGHLFSTGFSDYAPPTDDGDPMLFVAANYGTYREGATDLPVAVLVDGDTHSAAELLAAALQDGKRATIVGTVTAGAGCGEFTAGTQFNLPASGAVVHVPDCVRLRADGTSERRGVTPDMLVPWGPSDSAVMRVEKAAAALAKLQDAP